MAMNVQTVEIGGARRPLKKNPLSINLQELINAADRDGDGLSKDEARLVETLKGLDMDGDGEVEIHELIKIGEQKIADQQKIKNLKRLIVVIVIVFIIGCGVLMALMVAANEASKDTKPADDGVLKTTSGDKVAVSSVAETSQLSDLLTASVSTLRDVKEVVLATATGVAVHFIAEIQRSGRTVTMTTIADKLIIVDKLKVEVYDSDRTLTQTVTQETMGKRRLLAEERQNTPRRTLLSTSDPEDGVIITQPTGGDQAGVETVADSEMKVDYDLLNVGMCPTGTTAVASPTKCEELFNQVKAQFRQKGGSLVWGQQEYIYCVQNPTRCAEEEQEATGQLIVQAPASFETYVETVLKAGEDNKGLASPGDGPVGCTVTYMDATHSAGYMYWYSMGTGKLWARSSEESPVCVSSG